MRLLLSVLIVATLFTTCGESASADDETAYRAEVLRYLFECDSGSLHHKLQDHFGASTRDNEWSPRAELQLSDFFATDENSDTIDATCAADVCAVDFFMSFHEFATEYRPQVEAWRESSHPGYLPEGLHFPRGDGSTRLFVFRSTFDPADL